MEDDDFYVRKLAELIFVKEFEITDDELPPACLLTNDFPLKLRKVLLTRRALDLDIWEELFDKESVEMVSDYEEYATSLLFNSQGIILNELNIFDKFLSVCSFIRFCGDQVLRHSGMNYKRLDTDIFMQYYESFLKVTFLRRGGFLRLMECIHHHRFLEVDLDLAGFEDPSIKLSAETIEEIQKQSDKERLKWNTAYDSKSNIDLMMRQSAVLALKVVAQTTVDLSMGTKDHDSSKKGESPKESFKGDHLEEMSPKYSNSKSKLSGKQDEDTAHYENIIKAVICHNRSKGLDVAKPEHPIQKATEEILKHLKNKIQTLIQTLEE